LPSTDILGEEIVRLETMRDATRDDRARREADFAISRLEQARATLSIRKKVSYRENER
jgi:F-type H+-transporting ATPase subunit epsilon